jgi:hypothetical protein
MGKGEKEAMRSWLGAPVEPKLRKDEVTFVANNSAILFFHQNRNTDGCFDLWYNNKAWRASRINWTIR